MVPAKSALRTTQHKYAERVSVERDRQNIDAMASRDERYLYHHLRRHSQPSYDHGVSARAFDSPNDGADTSRLMVHRVAPLCRIFSFKCSLGMPLAANSRRDSTYDTCWSAGILGSVRNLIDRDLSYAMSQSEATTPTRRRSSQHNVDSVLRRLSLESQSPGNILLSSGRLSRSTWKSYSRQDRKARMFPRGSQADLA
jgi:hypothetical protein